MESLDLLVWRIRSEAHKGKKPSRLVDVNRKWKVLEVLLRARCWVEGDYARGITAQEIAKVLGISYRNVLNILRRLRVYGWVIRAGRWRSVWLLSPKALKFARKWGGFLRHPWIKLPGVRERC
ncbi:MAG: hypothetical protein DRO09_04270 [Thermoprotei archaeon]|mgnify:CR=1 FL=1|nr:MAG: hypothetical protein DRO09_04270 [Thermoprotei archaeon]